MQAPAQTFGLTAARIGEVAGRVVGPPYRPAARLDRLDIALAAVLFGLALAVAATAMSRIDPLAYNSFDLFFQADGPRTMSNMFDRWSVEQKRTHVHPIFSILTLPIATGLTRLGLSPLQAAQGLALGCAGLTTALIFMAGRGLGLPKLVSVLFGLVFVASATFIHWYAFVDTFAFAGLTIALVLWVLTSASSARWLLWILASAGALAITTTNWAFALVASFARLPRRLFLICNGAGLAAVVAMSLVQSATFPQARLFFDPTALAGEVVFAQPHRQAQGVAPWTPLANLRSALITSAVTPTPVVEYAPNDVIPHWGVTNQHVSVWTTPPQGLVAVALWILLLMAGAWGAWRTTALRRVALALTAYLASQLALHIVYGEITFLYAAHFFPAMVGLAFFSWFSPLRRWVPWVCAAFVVLAGHSNATTFVAATVETNALARACVAETIVCPYHRK